MYNETIKQTYLNLEQDDTKRSKVERLFQTVMYSEQFYGKDIAEMSPEECLYTFRNTVSLQYCLPSEINRSINLFFEYKQWISLNMPDIQVCDFESKDLSREKIHDSALYPLKFFKDAEQFLSFLQVLFDSSAEQTRNLSYILTYALIFNGVPLDSVSLIEKTDLDFNKKTIQFTYKGKNYTARMINSFIELYNMMCKLNEYHGVRNNKIHANYLLPVAGKSRQWRGAFSDETREIIESKKTWLQKNRELNKPVLLNMTRAKINGLVYRVRLEIYEDKNYLIQGIDSCTNDTDIIYLKLQEAFKY